MGHTMHGPISSYKIYHDMDFTSCHLVVCVFDLFSQNGVLLRTVLDPVTGDLSDTRTRYLGSRPVKLFRVRMQGQEAVCDSKHLHIIR